MATRRTAEEWGELIEQQQLSGMRRGEWCRKHGVNPDLMAKAESRQKARDDTTADLTWVEVSDENQITPSPMEKEEADWVVRIRSNGLEIEVHAKYPAHALATLLERLVKLC
jgi:hypothetical protein